MAPPAKHLISIGGMAWVDPLDVIAVDDQLSDGDPTWAAARVTLRTGQYVFGQRAPERIVRAIRHPEDEHEDDGEDGEVYPDLQARAVERARRRARPSP